MSQRMERDTSQAVAKPDVSSVAFSKIPHQSRLFLAFLEDPLSLKQFYPNSVELERLKDVLPTVLDNYQTDRAKLCDALGAINRKVGAHARTFENIERLRQPRTVAVVTGQQAGLFTGPIYTIYKALSAIRAADMLTAGGISAVPVFWVATEDHDFEEVSSAAFWDRSAKLASVTYDRDSSLDGLPVGATTLDPRIRTTTERLFELLPVTEFSCDLRESLQSAWSTDSMFGNAFMRNLFSLLGRYGLIAMDPAEPQLKELSVPIYTRAIDEAERLPPALASRGTALTESGFHTQVHTDEHYVPFFLLDEAGKRRTLRLDREGRFRVKGEKREIARDDLRKIAVEEPVRISPGVMLRPVVQDFLLPTICYFGGAAEIAYFAQNSEVFRILDRPATPIFHRQSFTVLGAGQKRFLDRYGLNLTDLFVGSEDLRIRLAQKSLAADLSKIFESTGSAIERELDRINQVVGPIDPTLSAAFAKRRTKIMHHLGVTRKKALLAKTRKDETFDRQLESLFDSLLLGGQLQERSINVHAFINRYGPRFIDLMYASVDLGDKGHRIVYL